MLNSVSVGSEPDNRLFCGGLQSLPGPHRVSTVCCILWPSTILCTRWSATHDVHPQCIGRVRFWLPPVRRPVSLSH